jgi:hypothetical protein
VSGYGIIWPSFWDSRTCSALVHDVRRGQPENLLLACFLMTSKHANVLGAFSMPLLYIQHDLGLTTAQADTALARLEALDWLVWDGELEFVWIKEMARIRLNLNKEEAPSQKDNRVIAAQRVYEALPSQRLVDEIQKRYGKDLRLKPRQLQPRLSESPLEAPSKVETTARGTVPDSTVQNSTKERTRGILAIRPHRGHAFCFERYCVPQRLHDEFAGQIGNAPVSLSAWYLKVIAELGDAPCADTTFDFWKARFATEIAPQLRTAPGAVVTRSAKRGVIDRMHDRLRTATRTAPIVKRSFRKE